MATPMLTSDERCFKRVGKDNRGLHQFLFMLSIRGQLNFLASLLNYKDEAVESDGLTLHSRDLVTGNNIFASGAIRKATPHNQLVQQGTKLLPNIKCVVCEVTADHQCSTCLATFCGMWHRTTSERLCSTCALEQPDKELLTQNFDPEDSATVTILAQSDPLTMQTPPHLPADLSIIHSDYRPAQATENIPGNTGAIDFKRCSRPVCISARGPCSQLVGIKG